MSDIALLPAEAMVSAFAAKTLSPLNVLQAVTERIARHNPEVNAFAVMNPGALQAARESAARWEAGAPAGVLDGVPVTVKDLVDVAGLPTRRGSRTTDAAPAATDAPLVAALRRAGAVITAKTTTTEFGWKSPGDCPLHGITRNPRNLAHTPGGSSAGAAAAAAAGFGPLHVGTDAGGSIRIPAAWSGVVGLKPTFGLVPQWPLGAFGHVAVAGPITRGVRDAALMLSALACFDPRDPFSLPGQGAGYLPDIEAGVAGLRIGVLQKPGFAAPADADANAAVAATRRTLEDQGAVVEDVAVTLPDTSDIFSKIWGAALARLVATTPAPKRPLLDAGLRLVADRFGAVTARDMLDAEALRVQAAHAMALFHRDFDALICPCVPAVAPLAAAELRDPVAALWQDWAPWTFLFNLTRQPAISLPQGVNAAGLPVAVQIAAGMYRDDLLLRVARAVERAG